MKRIIFGVGLAVFVANASAQQANTMYFMKHSPVRHALNPAFEPDGYSFYVGIPGISSVDVGFSNNSYVAKDGIYVQDGKLKTIFHRSSKEGLMGVMDEIRKSAYGDVYVESSLINFGFRTKKDHYYTIDISNKAEVRGTGKSEILDPFLDNSYESNGQEYDLSGNKLQGMCYTEFAVGTTWQLNDKWTIGAKLKYLYGHAVIKSDFSDLSLKTNYDAWILSGQGKITGGAPAVDFYNKGDEEFVQAKFGNIDSKFDREAGAGEWLRPRGHGAAVDFGAVYKFNDRLTLSASLLDLGWITWGKKHLQTLQGGDYTFAPMTIEDPNYPHGVLADLKKEVRDNAKDYYKMVDAENISTRLSTKLLVGAQYTWLDDKLGLGLLSKTYFAQHVREDLTVSCNYSPVDMVDLSLSYDFVNGRGVNWGFGANFNLGPINIFAVCDEIPFAWMKGENRKGETHHIPSKTRQSHISVGMNLLFGWNDKGKDDDGDGVPNRKDKCPDTPQEAWGFVDSLTGCPLDTDGDGVPDYLDKCPETPEAAYGQIDTLGCPLDTDGDGVPDYKDMCPGTPLEANGAVDEKGCLLDEDGDGVPDYKDKCPGTPREAYGKVDTTNGCPLDTDGDGVPDYKDECPSTPSEVGKMVDEKGCTLDSDGDGIPDYQDKCPKLKGVASNNGCPEIKAAVTKLFQKALNGIQFETGKATIKKTSNSILDQIVKVMKENPDYNLRINGHTDSTGDYNKNKKLSKDRAQAVKDYLVKKGIDATRLTAEGFGSDVPVADNKTAAGKAKNRRVEFIVEFTKTVME